ncbi:MAG: transaldolase [Solirubrobacterales bacterium]|nr:transaldolase [Solirubrobacterales bacterium]
MSVQALAVEPRIPGALRATVEQKVALAGRDEVARRLREGDPKLWGPPGAEEIADRLGWLTIADRMLDVLDELEVFAEQVSREGLADVVLLGMGGSSLAPEVLRRSFKHRPDRARLHVLDSTDAGAIRTVQEVIDPASTLFIVSSKSGGTIEPRSLFAHFSSLVSDGRNFVAITDPGTGLEELAIERGFRRVFHGDPNIGGRYSALSPFGIVPAVLMGVDAQPLLAGASDAWETPVNDGTPSAVHTAAVWLGAALSALAQAGRDKLTFLISPTLPGLGLWLEQLVAESTGKRGTGILPVAEEPLGEVGDYGEDRVFAYLPDVGAHEPELDAAAQALGQAGHPVLTIPTRGPVDLGRVFMLAELAVAVAGWGLQINPFDQPNVQQAKDATNRVLAEFDQRHELPQLADATEAELRALLLDAGPPQYISLMGYVKPSAEFDAAIAELRVAIRARTGSTTTFGYGPRFLHSTGQYHKGGPRQGRFLQLLYDSPPDVPIPGASYTFTTLKNAQAIGDLTTLRELGLPAERLRLTGEDAAAGVREITARIKEMT